ncbi:MAG: hypothetical protein AAFY10_09395 [Pseudomonadota bacterium]
MDQATSDALHWSWDFLARTLSVLVMSLGFDTFVPDLIARRARNIAFREVRCLEALARRLLLVESGHLKGELGMVTEAPPSETRKARLRRRGKVNAPGFGLFEPLPDPYAEFRTRGDQNLPFKATLSPCDLAQSKGLARRIAALQSLLQDPAKAARRLAHWRARPKVRRAVSIRMGRPPGNGCNPTEDLMASTLWHAHQLAMAELNRGPPGRRRTA